MESIRRLLVATAGRPPTLGCFGLHEWAMVHRHGRTRHDWPLRLGPAGTDEVVESHRIACSHFDAFRFFTAGAPAEHPEPGRDDRATFEQPGCLHAGMDLYKHAFRLTPLVPSELVADCFELAWDIRELDMRASPYDFGGLGFEPVRIETAAGKQEYVAAQRAFAERGAPLRQRLIDECDRLLAAASAGCLARHRAEDGAVPVGRVGVADVAGDQPALALGVGEDRLEDAPGPLPAGSSRVPPPATPRSHATATSSTNTCVIPAPSAN